MPQTKRSKRKSSSTRPLVVSAVLLVLAIGIVAIAPRFGGERNVASAVELPGWLDGFPADVREAYAYAAEHQDLLEYMSCYCGCENHGHTSNSSCYVKGVDSAGRIQWDSHAAT